ncbi:MAG: SpoIIE family protein phosphatase [Phycisphaera sp.]|nr:SpoIIE family protein phosphatase [Phycisphaera sp.]
MSSPKEPHYDRDTLLKLLEVAKDLGRPLELQALLTRIIDAGRSVLGADRGSVFLYDDKTQELFVKIATGLRELRFGIDKGIAGECARKRQIVNVPDCYADARFNQEVDKRTGYHTKCLIAIPLVGFDDELVGVLQLLNARKGQFDENDERIAVALSSQAAVAIQRARLMDERLVKLKLERDLETAKKIQLGVLPKVIEPCEGYEFAGRSLPAEQTGGDIYDVAPEPVGDENNRKKACRLLLLADATGHGIGPALSVTQVRAMIRIGVRLSSSLDTLFQQVNSQLHEDLSMERFVTAFLGRLDPVKHTVEYHAAGQGPLLIVRADGKVEWFNATTLPMGIMPDPPGDGLQTLHLNTGDILALITDGFYEYQDIHGKMFGKDRVSNVIVETRTQSAEKIMTSLFDEVHRFAESAPQLDDQTALIVKRVG